MAAPQRHEARPATPADRPDGWKEPGKYPSRAPKREVVIRRRRFSMLVVPVLLMLGSVYLHTVSTELGYRVTVLEEQRAQTLAEKEELELQVSALSTPGRIRGLARDLGMREPGSADLRIYEVNGEEKRQNGGEQAQAAR